MYKPTKENPSFSSSLLDEIYRSFDERVERVERAVQEEHDSTYRQASVEKQSYSYSYSVNGYFKHDRDVQRHGNSCGYVRDNRDNRDNRIENWIGKEVRSGVEFKRSQRSVNSSSSSSDSSSGGGFSSSETDSVYCVSSRPKPIRTSSNKYSTTTVSKQKSIYDQRYQFDDVQTKQKHESKFVKTKSRAMKIYGDLKKAKQPISPGGRLATFLNSIFTNTKRSSSSTGSYNDRSEIESKSASVSTCSSASSFSRSCLSKTPSSRGKLSNSNMKRSVRFYPVSVIVGDDCQPCGHKSLYKNDGNESNLYESKLHALKFVKNPNEDELRVYPNEKTRRIEEAARNLLLNYQKKVECEFDLITSNLKAENEIDLNYDDDDDVASNTSSDLFELENFSAIGMEDELPVYETTNLDTNLAIGNGFRMCN